MSTLRLATRGSDLARTQSSWVASEVKRATGRASELILVETTGDRKQVGALAEVGNVGLFTKEVQEAVLDGRADYAVHSLKDLPAEQVPGLCIAAIPPREDCRDYLLVRPQAFDANCHGILPVREGCRIGTASARRAAFLAALAPQLQVEILRGNVPTRVQRLRSGDYDAILLAGAGLRRLGLDLDGLQVLPLSHSSWPNAPGQGALAIECRADDAETRGLLEAIHDAETAAAIGAERSLLRALGGGCGLPLGAFAKQEAPGRYRMVAALGPLQAGDPPLRRVDIKAERMEHLAGRALEALQG